MISNTLPMALLLAAFATIGDLSRTNQLTALLGGGISIGQASTDGAAVTDGRVSNMRHSLGEERRVAAHERIEPQRHMSRQGADMNGTVLRTDPAQRFDARDVHQQAGIRQSEGQRSKQRLPASQDLHCRSMLSLDAPPLDWVALARGHGVPGVAVDDAATLLQALERGFASGGPCLIEARLPA